MHVKATDLELVLEVNVRGGEKGVDAVIFGFGYGLKAAVNVLLARPGQAADGHGAVGATIGICGRGVVVAWVDRKTNRCTS